MKKVKIGRDRTNFVHALIFAGKWFLCYNIFCRVPLERRWISPFTWTTQSKRCAVNSHKMAQLFWGYLKGDVISITSRKVFKKYSLSMVYILGHLRTNAIALTFTPLLITINWHCMWLDNLQVFFILGFNTTSSIMRTIWCTLIIFCDLPGVLPLNF